MQNDQHTHTGPATKAFLQTDQQEQVEWSDELIESFGRLIDQSPALGKGPAMMANTVQDGWGNQPWAKDVPAELAETLNSIERGNSEPPTLALAVSEARGIIRLHKEGSVASADMLSDDSCKEARREALLTIKACNEFIKKYGSGPSLT